MKIKFILFLLVVPSIALASSEKCSKQVNQELDRLGMGSLDHAASCMTKVTGKSFNGEKTQIIYSEKPSKHYQIDPLQVSGADKSAEFNPAAKENNGDPQLIILARDLMGQNLRKIINYDGECNVLSVEVSKYDTNQETRVLKVTAESCQKLPKTGMMTPEHSFCQSYKFKSGKENYCPTCHTGPAYCPTCNTGSETVNKAQ